MAVENKEPVPRLLLVYLRNAFVRYLEDGAPIDRSLRLRPAANRPKGTHGKKTDPVCLAALSFLFRRIKKLLPTAANVAVATECSTTERNVEMAVSENADFERLTTEELRALSIPEDFEAKVTTTK
jgi:hypothetical protein